jgi:hypothetical protein
VNQAEKIDAIFEAVKPPALFPELLNRTDDGPLVAGASGQSPLYIPSRYPAQFSLEVIVNDPVSFRYRFRDPFGRVSYWHFAQLFRVRGA